MGYFKGGADFIVHLFYSFYYKQKTLPIVKKLSFARMMRV
jgi:hypothetical protein